MLGQQGKEGIAEIIGSNQEDRKAEIACKGFKNLTTLNLPKMSSVLMSLNGLIPLKLVNENGVKSSAFIPFLAKKTKPSTTICCTRLDNTSQSNPTTQQLSLSVLRFTFGIPGLDESYLPRWIGYAFGSLLLLNHFVGSDTSAITPSQFRIEVLGICLAAFSVVVPYLGKFLKGATTYTEKTIPDGAEQIFLLSPNITESLKEDLAWGSYVLLRNTNTTSVIISVKGAFCVRGYWNNIEALSKDRVENLFELWTKKIGLFELKDTLYLPQAGDMQGWDMVPRGSGSILVEPVLKQTQNVRCNEAEEKSEGFILLASCTSYAYTNKDRSWIQAVAKKFTGIISIDNI